LVAVVALLGRTLTEPEQDLTAAVAAALPDITTTELLPVLPSVVSELSGRDTKAVIKVPRITPVAAAEQADPVFQETVKLTADQDFTMTSSEQDIIGLVAAAEQDTALVAATVESVAAAAAL
jgi:F420-0:gamma-glutamyl ligase